MRNRTGFGSGGSFPYPEPTRQQAHGSRALARHVLEKQSQLSCIFAKVDACYFEAAQAICKISRKGEGGTPSLLAVVVLKTSQYVRRSAGKGDFQMHCESVGIDS